METKILSDEELAELTDYKARAYQRRWLVDRQWVFVESRGKRPLVDRMYARMKLGMISPYGCRSEPAAGCTGMDTRLLGSELICAPARPTHATCRLGCSSGHEHEKAERFGSSITIWI